MRFYSLLKKLNIRSIIASLAIVGFCMFIAACADSDPENVETISDKTSVEGFVMPKAGTFDSADSEAVVVSIDKGKNTCTLYNRTVGKNYTLTYDGTSKIYDKYGSLTVIDQISAGDVVDVTFLKSKKLLNSMTKSADIWVYDDVSDFEIDALNGRMVIDGAEYRFKEDLLIFAGQGKAQLMDINSCDRLKVIGNDRNIYSITIEQGHGYLRLKGQDYFEGGWIEVGKIIKTVNNDMLLAVPVGKYDIKLKNGEYEGVRNVVIESNKETVLDVSDMVVVDSTMYGTLILVTDPSDAEVFVDGKEADISKPLSLEYGIHQLIVRKEGYESLTQYIKVGQESATLEIALDKKKDYSANDTPNASPSPVVTSVVTQAAVVNNTSDYRVTIEAPEQTEVYVDGSYIGIVPASFAKSEGTHVITLRKDGYVTRSYTIALDGVLRNETFSFATLEKIE
ncbi:MAG: PEGA domain-containing protein [Lachnospiraceae bacterium]|nr:PEGA domain-containing protein [Lachnospiraceae bacterium]